MRLVRLSATLLVLVLSTVSTGIPPAGSVDTTRPNIVLILTDDMRYDQLPWMPTVSKRLVMRGTDFRNGFVVNPFCCPSRTTILTGKYSHGTDIYSNDPPYGGFPTFHDEGEESSTIATWLQAAGYRTGLVGKYLNGYGPSQVGWVPPGWNYWRAMMATSDDSSSFYYNYTMSLNGTPKTFGSEPKDYSTDVLRQYDRKFILTTPSSQPLFLYFAPTGPHAPATPPPRYADSCTGLSMPTPPSFNEEDVSDKPNYISSRSELSAKAISNLKGLYVNQCRSLLAVDDAVSGILNALKQTGRLSNTLIVFASDNGLLFGEHRWRYKKVPYEESIRVPLVVRYDPLTAGGPTTDDHLALNLDIAPTFADAGGVDAPGAEGASLLPLLDGSATGWRSDFLVEHRDSLPETPVPTYCAVRDETHLYVKYGDGFEELYDLSVDPYELTNVANSPNYALQKATMYQELLHLCSPPPPDYTP